MIIEITVNNHFHRINVPPNRRLIDFLRDDLGLKGTKHGCDQGECGACSVILNNKIVTSCLVLMAQIPHQSKILTIEANDEVMEVVRDAFINEGAIQCGVCTPGMIMATTALFHENPKATQGEIKEALSGVLCRCTGYTKILNAVMAAQAQLQVGYGGLNSV
jgi:carbon-monoxide dehydrogenase small subunit